MCEGCPIESGMTTERLGMTTERLEMPDRVGHDRRGKALQTMGQKIPADHIIVKVEKIFSGVLRISEMFVPLQYKS